LHHFPLRILEQQPGPQSDTVTLVFLVHAADILAKGFKDGALHPESMSAIDPHVRAELKLDAATWEEFRLKAEEEIGKARAFLEIL
jgi:hypothetical protein